MRALLRLAVAQCLSPCFLVRQPDEVDHMPETSRFFGIVITMHQGDREAPVFVPATADGRGACPSKNCGFWMATCLPGFAVWSLNGLHFTRMSCGPTGSVRPLSRP